MAVVVATVAAVATWAVSAVVVVAEVLMAAVVGSMVVGAALMAAAESTVARGGSTKAAVLTERVALTMDAGSVILTAAASWTAVHGSMVPPGSMLAEAWMGWGDSTALPDWTESLASTARADLPAMRTWRGQPPWATVVFAPIR
jgi:hypothetical protein